MGKHLVAYFSATGTTKKVATTLAQVTAADLHEIKPLVAYEAADLNWRDEQARSTVEMKDPAFRPALAVSNLDLEPYDVVYVGFPIWWHQAPTLINTFLESYDFKDKTVVVFATHGGGGWAKTTEHIQASLPSSTKLVEGNILDGWANEDQLKNWVADLDV